MPRATAEVGIVLAVIAWLIEFGFVFYGGALFGRVLRERWEASARCPRGFGCADRLGPVSTLERAHALSVKS
jgi:hypothetical protein